MTNAPNRPLRKELDQIVEILFPVAYRAALEGLREKYRHTIEILPGEQQWLDIFNCYTYALGLVDVPRHRTLVQRHGSSVLADTTFVTGLIDDGELREISEAEVKAGTLVLYFNGDKLTHAGLIMSAEKRVRSKWGPSEFYEHGLWEVMASYGDKVHYFAPPDVPHVLDVLEQYVTD